MTTTRPLEVVIAWCNARSLMSHGLWPPDPSWKDRRRQKRCPLCGRFATWNDEEGRWETRCRILKP